MNITVTLELYTEIRNGGQGSILMFSKECTIHPDQDTLIEWLTPVPRRITDTNIIFILTNFHTEEHSNIPILRAYGCGYLTPNTPLASYSFFVQHGWIPNSDAAKAIRSHGYTLFEPEKF